ncbi:MAG TPA: hypothetical protein VFW71_11930 [Actinomycetota bacterium]|nr:hypothetical protein [Actinomycetota bacterium]
MRPPTLRRLTTTAWLSGMALVPPAVVALLDGLAHGLALRSMMPDVLAMTLTVAAPVWPLSLLAGSIILRRGKPGPAPADAQYPTTSRLAIMLLGVSAAICIIEVATLALWPARFNPAWFGTTAGGFLGFAGLGLVVGLAARWQESRMALGLWTNPRALVALFTNAGSDHPPETLYYGGGIGPGVR